MGCGTVDQEPEPEPEVERTPAETFCAGSQQCNSDAFDAEYESYTDCVRSLEAFIDDHFEYFSGSYSRECAIAYTMVSECYINNSGCFPVELDGETYNAFYGPDGSCEEESAAMLAICVRE